MTFKLGSKVTGVDDVGQGAEGAASSRPRAAPRRRSRPTSCWSRSAACRYTEGLGLEEVGVALDKRGRVVTDAHFATNVAGIYAIGDVIAGPMLAHKAEDEGIAVAEILAGQAGHVNYDVDPERGLHVPGGRLGRQDRGGAEGRRASPTRSASSRSPPTAAPRPTSTTEGFVKILADAKTDRVLGVHIVGADAGDMIAEAAVAMEFGASSEDIARTCHAHPTLPEAVKEAALAVAKRAIHM